MEQEIVFFYAVVCVFFVNARFEGESCVHNNTPGTCRRLPTCTSAIDSLKKKINPQLCSFNGTVPIVCCPAQRPLERPRPTTEYVPEYYTNDIFDYPPVCDPIPAHMTAKKTGQKAFDKCLEYQEKYVLPCEDSKNLTGRAHRKNYCHHAAIELVHSRHSRAIRGDDAAMYEFPHMAMLGFQENGTKTWVCAGIIVSEGFILTVGHCSYNAILGEVKFAAIGILRRSDLVDSSKVYDIGSIIRHPDYKAPYKYNDIALLKTKKQMKLDHYVYPACLAVADYNGDTAIATGWGAVEFRGSSADHLQKVTLTRFETVECQDRHPITRLMPRGFDKDLQICYGDHEISRGTCQGDSGGPLQIRSKEIYCMYQVIGITSFGKGCGFVGEPTIFTNVRHYVPWIESVVWPN